MDQTIRHRVRLWLKSEQAMGQPSLPVRLVDAPAASAGSEARRSQPSARPAPGASHAPSARPAPLSRPAPAAHPAPGSVAQPAARSAPMVPAPPAAASAPALLPLMDNLLATPPLSRQQRIDALAAMDANEVSVCSRCDLCRTRTRTVFGEGDPEARLMFIGEGPGDTEDRTGRPFVGRAGQLLDKMIAAMGLKRQEVYIANLVKCRAYIVGPPHKDRAPTLEETEACAPYLLRQIDIIRPEVIVTLGLPSTRFMLSNPRITMHRIRGKWQTWRGIRLMPTYHPSYILRDYTRATRAAVWEDLQQVMAVLGLPPPTGKKAPD